MQTLKSNQHHVRLLLLAVLVVLGTMVTLVPDKAEAIDRLGAKWVGCEYTDCSWKFEWRRTTATSNVFNAYWRHREFGRFQGVITISISGSMVTVSRPALGGGPPCTYTGKYEKRDITQGRPARVSGTYTCGSFTGPWKATIR